MGIMINKLYRLYIYPWLINHLGSVNYYFLLIKEDILSFIDDLKNFGFNGRLLFICFWSYTVNTTRTYYLKNDRSHSRRQQQQQQQQRQNNSIEDQMCSSSSQSVPIETIREVTTIDNSLSEANNNKLAFENRSRVEPEVGIPKMRFFPYYFYYILSTSAHVYMIFQSTLLILMYNYPNLIDIKYNCYLLGRVTFNVSIIKYMPYFTILSNFLHIGYRLFNGYHLICYRIDLLPFLLTSPKRLKQHLLDDKCIERYQELAVQGYPKDDYLRDILYIEIEVFDKMTKHYMRPNSKKYYLRPNRNLAAHRKMISVTRIRYSWCMFLYWTIFIPVQPNIVNSALFDIYYIQNYPTCNPHLEALHNNGKLSRFSVSLEWFPPNHRSMAGTFDVINNCILWQDDLAALLFPITLGMIMTEDLIIYWHDIRKRLDKMLEKIIQYNKAGLLMQHYHIYAEKSRLPLQSNEKNSPTNKKNIENYQLRLKRKHVDKELTEEVLILQRFMSDFFKQLKSYDRYVSLLSTLLFSIWLLAFTATSYFAIKIEDTEVIFFIRFTQIYAAVTLSVPTFALLRLRSQTKSAYLVINNIMAHEKSPKRQLSWCQMLEYYTRRNSYGFTILHSYPLEWTTYLNVIASSVSCLIVFETFVRYSNNHPTKV